MTNQTTEALAEQIKRLAEDMADAACATEAGAFVERQRKPLHEAIDRLASLSAQPPAPREPAPLFRYDGPIYVRPCERGIVLTDLNGVDLESAVGEGDYFITAIRAAKIRAAEEAVIASIPRDLRDIMNKAQAAHEAKGGCPGCGSMVLACHDADCPTLADDLY